MTVPEIDGKPAAFVSVTIEDKINIGNFQNVTHTATVGVYVADDPEVIDATLVDLAHNRVEPFLGQQRSDTLEALSG